VGAAVGPFFDGDVVDEVDVVDLYMKIGKCAEPAAEELDAGWLSLATHASRGLKDDVVG
jgi:hypothetical protein